MQLQQAKSRAEAANKLVLEAKEERDAAEKAVEELKRQLQPKRASTDDDAGDAHEVLAEVEVLKFAMHDEAEAAREKAVELAQNAQSTAAAAGSVANGASIQGQAAAAVLAAEREDRAPVAHQVSEEEFERRQALVKHQSFWSWLQHTDNATHFKSKENLNFSTPYRFSMQGHHVMFFFYVSWCTEALCEEVVQLLVHGMLACAWPRTTDPSPVDRISWWKVVRAPSRPFGQKTNLLSQHHQGFGILT